MNANPGRYYNDGLSHGRYDSDSIRKAYLNKARKNAIADVLDSSLLWYVLFAMKVIGGIVCAIVFFSVLGMIEAGSMTPAAGILCTVLAALLECLCFLPIGSRPSNRLRK